MNYYRVRMYNPSTCEYCWAAAFAWCKAHAIARSEAFNAGWIAQYAERGY